MTYKAIAVRPYPNPLRARVFALLSEAGVEVEVPPELEGAATNDEVIAHLRGRRPDLLLVPYHALRDRQAERTSGLELLLRLRAELPELRRVPVVMPVSIYGRLAFDAMWRQQAPEAVFPMLEGDIEDSAFVVTLRQALREHLVVR